MGRGLDRGEGLSLTEQEGRVAEPSAPPPASGGRFSRLLHRHPAITRNALLSGPVLWLVLAYLGSLVALLLRSVFQRDELSDELIREPTFDNIRTVLTGDVYRSTTVRTIGIALVVTLIDLVIALPMATYMAKVARPRARRIMAAAVLMPLWASYVVKAYAWRALLDPVGGVLQRAVGRSPGYGLAATTITLAYLWLPYMILPIYAGLERLPDSLLEASGDLGARSGRTFRSIVIPMLVPSLLAGSIFTFSLTIGDYIAVQFVGGTTQTLGLVVYKFFLGGNDLLAAAFALVPIAIMGVYLFLVGRAGALENL